MTSTHDFTNGNLNRQMLLFALPVLIGNLFQQFYNIADTAVAGRLLGETALSAIGSASSVNSLVLTIAFGLNGGFGIIVARSFGEKNFAKLKKAFAKSILYNAVFSFCAAVFSVFLIKPVMRLMNTPEKIFDEAYSYIIVLLVCSFTTMFYNLEATVLRSLGDGKTPLYFIIISALLNIALDFLFIGTFKTGVRGAAIATVIAQGVSCVLCALVIIKDFKILKLGKSDFKKDKDLFRSMLSAGITMALMNSIFSIGSIIMQAAVNSLGSLIIAAHVCSRKIAEMFMQPLVTVGSACSTFVSQNYGAGNFERIKRTMKLGGIYSAVWSAFTFVVLFFLGGALVSLITGSSDGTVSQNAVMYLKVNAPFYVLLGLLFNLRFSIQSIGSKIPPLISSSMELISKLLAAFLLIPQFGYIGACVAEPLSWTLGAVYLIFAFSHAYKRLTPKDITD